MQIKPPLPLHYNHSPPPLPPSSTRPFPSLPYPLPSIQMELQWEHIGYEREGDGSAAYHCPLWRCPVCRVCKDVAHPHQPHAPDCRLHGLLAEYAGRTKNHFATTVSEQQLWVSEGAKGRGGGQGGGIKEGGEGNGAVRCVCGEGAGGVSL